MWVSVYVCAHYVTAECIWNLEYTTFVTWNNKQAPFYPGKYRKRSRGRMLVSNIFWKTTKKIYGPESRYT